MAIERFISYGEMIRDAEAWAESGDFDNIAAVCGIPRSGAMVASIIAAHRNMHVVQYDSLLRNEKRQPPLRRGRVRMPDGPIMVIDDTVRGGAAMRKAKAELSRIKGLVFGSLYVRDFSAHHVQKYGHIIPRWSIFQWNWKHDSNMRYTLVDLDGVIHPDGHRDMDIRPIFRPTVPVMAIVTGRGEHLRDITEAWLAKWGIKHDALHMAPACPDARDDIGGPAGFKAKIYRQYPEARLFVESDIR